MAGELDEHLAVVEAHVPVAVGGKPRDLVRPDDDDAAAGPADPLHLRQAGLAAMLGSGRERRARDDQVRVIVGHGEVIEEAMGHAGTVPDDPLARAFDSGSRATAQRVRSPRPAIRNPTK